MARSAYRTRASPSAARPASATSVTVVLRLVRAVHRHADVVRLILGQLGEPDPERVQVQPGHLLVQVLGQRVHAGRVLVGLGEQLDLGDDLVGEAVGDDEAGVTGGVAEVQQAALGQHDDAVAILEGPLVHLRLDDGAADAGRLRQAGHVDLVVEVADVAHDGLVLHPAHVVGGDHVAVAGGGDEDVRRVHHVLERGHLVAVHGRLERADRVDLGDDDPGALAAQALRAALAYVAVAADDGDLAADEHVRAALDAVDQRVTAAVLVVELRLGNRVVDVDRRELELAGLEHLVEAVHAGGGLLGDALDLGDGLGPLGVVGGDGGAQLVEDDPPLLVVVLGRG